MNTPKYESEFDIDNDTHQGFRPRIYVTENGETGDGNEHGEQENEKWNQSRELEMNFAIGPRFQLGFFPILHFCRFPCSFFAPCSLFSNIPPSPAIK